MSGLLLTTLNGLNLEALFSLAAATPADAATAKDVIFGLVLTLVGMLVVFVSLLVIALLIVGGNRLELRLTEPASQTTSGDAYPLPEIPAPETASGVEPAAQQADQADQTELIAVLTAAATAALRARVRVRRVTLLGTSQGAGSWVTGGRMTLLGSHKPHLKGGRR